MKKNHIYSIVGKCEKVLNVMRSLSGSTWGAGQDIQLILIVHWPVVPPRLLPTPEIDLSMLESIKTNGSTTWLQAD